jgi:hypothetical protein
MACLLAYLPKEAESATTTKRLFDRNVYDIVCNKKEVSFRAYCLFVS